MVRLRAAVAISILATWSCHSAPAASTPTPDAGEPVVVQLLTMSTWLGQLDPVALVQSTDGGTAPEYGGLAVLSTYLAAERAKNPNTALFMGGDSFGASPPLSSRFDDVPAVKALGFLDAQVDMLANHDFNEGIPYLANLIQLSSYPYVATNLNEVQAQVSSRVAVPFVLVHVGPVTIGVLGLTDPDDPNKTLPTNFGTTTIAEPVVSANTAAKLARAAGAQAVVALTDLETTGTGIAGVHTGPLIDFAAGLTGVDVAIGATSNEGNPGTVQAGSALVVEDSWKGISYGRTQLHFSQGLLTSVTADVVLTDVSAVTPDPAAVALLAPYRTQLGQVFDGTIGIAEATFPLGAERVQETALGDLVSAAFLARYASLGAQVAIYNSAGLRDALPSSYAPSDMTLRRPTPGYASGPPYDLVVGDPYAVLPFGNLCVLRPVTGALLWQVLEESVVEEPAASNGFLQVAGLEFTYSLSAPAGARVQSVTLDDGTVITRDDATTLMLVDTDYLDTGGDDYGMLIETPPATGRDVDADVLLGYLQANPDLTPAIAGRITQVP